MIILRQTHLKRYVGLNMMLRLNVREPGDDIVLPIPKVVAGYGDLVVVGDKASERLRGELVGHTYRRRMAPYGNKVVRIFY